LGALSAPAILWLAHESGKILEVYKPSFPAEFDSKVVASNLIRFSKNNGDLNFAIFFDGLLKTQILVSVYEAGSKGTTSCASGCSLCSSADSTKCLICSNSNGLKMHSCGSTSCDGWYQTTTASGAIVCEKCHQSCTSCSINGMYYSRFKCDGCQTGYSSATSSLPDRYDPNWKNAAPNGCFCNTGTYETETGCFSACTDKFRYMVVFFYV
jgi:hypothetical protein